MSQRTRECYVLVIAYQSVANQTDTLGTVKKFLYKLIRRCLAHLYHVFGGMCAV